MVKNCQCHLAVSSKQIKGTIHLIDNSFHSRAEILQKEENDLVVFDIREEILEDALRIGYERYMERQNALFTAHCAAQAWLKLIDWSVRSFSSL